MFRIIAIILGICLGSPAVSAAFDLYVYSVKAPLFEEPKVGAQRIAEVRQGEKLVGIGVQESWYRIDHEGRQLWIFSLMVRKTPLPDRKIPSQEEVDQMSQSARTRPSAFTTTAAARGLREKRGKGKEKYRLDYGALKKMESFGVTEGDAIAFMEEMEK